jgi:predicted nucleic acid-binding protein
MIVISDTSPITNLAAIGQLDILRVLYGQIIIPVAVYNELVQAPCQPIPGAIEVQTLSWIQTQRVSNLSKVNEILAIQLNIDRGEAEAIQLALELKANLIIIDEKRARMLATSLGLKVTGLLGILIQAKNQQVIVAVKPLIDRLIQEADFRLSEVLYQTVLKLAGE